MNRRPPVAWILALFVAVVLTNRYENPEDPAYTGPGDARAYLALAQSAPALPDTRIPYDLLAFHHGQRLALPYGLGLAHRATRVPYHRLFQAAVVVIGVTIVLLFARALEALSIGRRQAAVMLSMLVLNPWALRQYLTFPEMVTDLTFVLGLALVLHGLVLARVSSLLIGQLVASLGRQNGLLLLPVVLWWLWRGESASRLSGQARLAAAIATTALAVGVYVGTSSVAAMFAGDNINTAHVFGLGEWVLTEFDATVLGALLARTAAPLLIPFAFFLAAARGPRTGDGSSSLIPLLLCASFIMTAQALLPGPDITAGNGPRYATLGVLPLYLALAIALRDARMFPDTGPLRRLTSIMVLLALGSLHHWFVYSGMPSAVHRVLFAVGYGAACIGCFLVASAEARDETRAGLQPV